MGIRKLCIFVVYFGHKGKYTLRFIPFCTMDVSRCVLITVEQRIWKSVEQYLSERKTGYNWIVNRPKTQKNKKLRSLFGGLVRQRSLLQRCVLTLGGLNERVARSVPKYRKL